jgi:hypothetical protein
VPYQTFLIQTVEAELAITMPELASRLLDEHGIVATLPLPVPAWLLN